MPLITVTESGPPPEKDVTDGVYPVILTALNGPKTIYPADKPQGTDIFEWVFAVDDERGTIEIQDNTSTMTGPRSKMYGWLTALLGGKAPAVGQAFDARDLVGRRALATIGHKATNWPYISQLMAMPAAMLQQQFAQATGTPTQAPVGQPARSALNMQPAAQQAPAERRPVAAPVAVADAPADDLPF